MTSKGSCRAKVLWISSGVALAIGGVAAYQLAAPSRLHAEGAGFLRDGEMGFVVSQLAYAVGPDTENTSACPAGMSKNVAEIFGATPEGTRRNGEDDELYSKRLEEGGRKISSSQDGKNYCQFPELAPHDPHTQMMLDPSAKADGIDLDGNVSRTKADQSALHLDFESPSGVKGVDNQFWRLTGCTRSYQSTGSSNLFGTEMLTGAWGILITLSNVDDMLNDDHVEVGIFANADPIEVSSAREALEYATYAKDQNPRYRAKTKARIVKGKLYSDPVDIRVHNVVNGMYLERVLKGAQIQATLSPQGVLKGYIAGYTPVTELYDNHFGYRNGKEASGKQMAMQRILGTANGAARVLGHTCQGMWQSMHKLADGHPDERGRYTSLSTQYKFEARPAFVVDVETSSANAPLVKS